MRHFIIYILSMLIIQNAYAGGLTGDLQKLFSSMGGSSNSTKPSSFKDQSGGYYTGGSLFVRNKVNNTQLLNITPPSFSAGCGGIDMYTGALSFLNKDALVNTLKTIGSNATSYAFNLALQTMTPQIYNTLNELNALAQEVNNMNINSCEAAATMVGSVWPKNEVSSRYLCSAMGSHNNVFSDYAEARHECGASDNRTAKAGNNNEFEDVLGDEFNLAWIALRKNGFLSTDQGLAELFMSVSGTIISRKEGEKEDDDGSKKGKYKKQHYSSLAKNNDFIQALIEGSETVSLYKCKNVEKCLHMTTQDVKLQQHKGEKFVNIGLRPKIEGLLRSMSNKIVTDGTISNEEKALVNASTIPIFRVLAIQAAFREGSSPIDISNFSESIAYDLLLKYLEEILDIVDKSLREFGSVQIDDSSVESLKKEAANTRRLLLQKRNGIYQQMHYTLSIINNSKQTEQQIHNMFSQTNANKR